MRRPPTFKMAELNTPQFEKSVDLTEMRCPNLIIAVIHELKQMPQGHILQVIAADLNAPSNIAAWCRQSGHPLLEMYEENGRFVFFLQRLAQASDATPSFQNLVDGE